MYPQIQKSRVAILEIVANAQVLICERSNVIRILGPKMRFNRRKHFRSSNTFQVQTIK